MKTAVSIPDDLFAEAEELAKRLEKPRSQLYAEALREYVSSFHAREISEALNRVYEHEDQGVDPFLVAASAHVLKNVEWE